MKIKKMFNVDDPAQGQGTEKPIETKVDDSKKEETVKEAGLFKGFTPEQVLKMKEDLRLEYEKNLEKAREEAKSKGIEEYKKQLFEEKEAKEKKDIFDKIENDNKLKKQFEDYGVDYKTVDKNNLNTYMKIFEGKKSETTANPKGEKIVDPNSNIDFDKIISEEFDKAGV